MPTHPAQKPGKWINPEKQGFLDIIKRWRLYGGKHADALSDRLLSSMLGIKSRSGFSRRLDGEIKFTPYEIDIMARTLAVNSSEIDPLRADLTRRAGRLRSAWEIHRAQTARGRLRPKE